MKPDLFRVAWVLGRPGGVEWMLGRAGRVIWVLGRAERVANSTLEQAVQI